MLQSPKSLDLISRYLNNPTDTELQNEINEFRGASIANEDYFLEVEKIWKHSISAARLEGVSTPVSAQKLKNSLIPEYTPRRGYITWFRSIAASIILFAVGYLIYTQSNTISYIIKTTTQNQIDSVKLADGSVIILSANTELKYPEKFDSANREVSLLKGQAFFKIAKDANHPFKVGLNQSNVVVLGTSFNIKITDDKIELGVKTGRVLFSPYKDGATSILTAGQALSYDIKKRELVTKTANNLDSWLTKELVFVDTPLEDVCEQLTNYYGTIIKLQDSKHTTKKLNAKFTGQTLNDVLIVLNGTYNIKINKENNQINLVTP
jgi:transmembrane sensor